MLALEVFEYDGTYDLKQGVVYVVQAASGGPVKIGRTTNPFQRLTQLQTAHHEDLRFVALFKDKGNLEKQLHRKYADSRKTGEWFTPTVEMASDLGVSLSGTAIPTLQQNARLALKWPSEVAAALGVGRDFLRDHNVASELKMIELGSVRLVSVAELDRWLETRARDQT